MSDLESIKAKLKEYNENPRERGKLALTYYKKLLRASLLVSTVPIIVVAIMVIYGRLTFFEGLASAIAVLFGSTFFAKPYFDDLSSLTKYVTELALNKRLKAPELSFLGNVEELSNSVKNLNKSWEERNIQLETALAETSILFDTIPDILIMLDKNNIIVRANNTAINNFHDDIIRKNISEIISDNDFEKALKITTQSGKQQSLEISSNYHGVQNDYLVMLERFPVKSIVGTATVLIMHNITETKRVKQTLKDFVANASHEIRTPLTSVMGFIENMQSMGDSSDDKKTRTKFLRIMSEQTQRMAKLVNDLLSLSKAEINEDKNPTENIDVNEILSGTIKRLQFLADEQNIKIQFSKKKNIPMIKGEPDELIQIFTNIISNAIKYGKPKGKVKISTSKTSDFTRNKRFPKGCKELILISFSDDGEGIEAEHLARITERFYRVDKARSRKIGGTGLGLAITKHLINRHRGDLQIQSTPGKGSTFTVRLPV